jgi:hypothetical protein
VSSGLLRRVDLVRTDVSEEPGASFIRVTKIGELENVFLRSVRRLLVAACVVPSSPIFVTLMKKALSSSKQPTHAAKKYQVFIPISSSQRASVVS